jgi:hypothetical protein
MSLNLVNTSLSIKSFGKVFVCRLYNFFLKLTDDLLISIVLGDHVVPIDSRFHEFPDEI